MLLLPVHLAYGHWVLLILHMLSGGDKVLIQGCDPTRADLDDYLPLFKTWIVCEARKAGKKEFTEDNICYQKVNNLAIQSDAINCGVLLLQNMKRTVDNLFLTYTSTVSALNVIRARWMFDIAKGCIADCFPSDLIVDISKDEVEEAATLDRLIAVQIAELL
jgi:hypothetical protein